MSGQTTEQLLKWKDCQIEELTEIVRELAKARAVTHNNMNATEHVRCGYCTAATRITHQSGCPISKAASVLARHGSRPQKQEET